MAGVLWRLLWAVIAVVLFYALLPPVARVLGFSIDGDVLAIIKIVVAGLAVLYIFAGGVWPWRQPPAA